MNYVEILKLNNINRIKILMVYDNNYKSISDISKEIQLNKNMIFKISKELYTFGFLDRTKSDDRIIMYRLNENFTHTIFYNALFNENNKIIKCYNYDLYKSYISSILSSVGFINCIKYVINNRLCCTGDLSKFSNWRIIKPLNTYNIIVCKEIVQRFKLIDISDEFSSSSMYKMIKALLD